MEPPSIRELDEAADAYYDLNDQSWKLRGQVEEAKKELLETMKKHGLVTYAYEDKEVTVVDKEVVKVKRKKAEEDA